MINPKYRLEKLNTLNVDTALEICDEYLGTGLYTREGLIKASLRRTAYYCLVYEGDTAAGIFFCSVMEEKEAAQTVTDKISDYCDEDERIGICHSIAIRYDYRKSGLAQSLLQHFSLLLHHQQKVDKIFALAWINHMHTPAANILAECGFEECVFVPKPWYEKEGLSCPLCKKPKCECNGMLYGKIWRR